MIEARIVRPLRADLIQAQHGMGPLADVVMPEPGERVIEVPQASSFLMSVFEPSSVLGLPVAVVETYMQPRYGYPQWHVFDQRHDPAFGYGLLVVRDGVLRRGPARWDSS